MRSRAMMAGPPCPRSTLQSDQDHRCLHTARFLASVQDPALAPLGTPEGPALRKGARRDATTRVIPLAAFMWGHRFRLRQCSSRLCPPPQCMEAGMQPRLLTPCTVSSLAGILPSDMHARSLSHASMEPKPCMDLPKPWTCMQPGLGRSNPCSPLHGPSMAWRACMQPRRHALCVWGPSTLSAPHAWACLQPRRTVGAFHPPHHPAPAWRGLACSHVWVHDPPQCMEGTCLKPGLGG